MNSRVIIDRAKEALGLTSDLELARTLNISKSTLSNWKTRNSIDYDILFSKCEHIDLNWLINGKDLSNPKTSIEDNKLIPLIPTEAFAGYGEYTFDDMSIEDYYTIQDFDNADFLIRIKGDSMSPKYNGGDVIACKLVKEVTFWQWHRVYAIYTRNQGVLIKRVEEYPQNSSFITLVSENPAYKPFELHEDEIISVALVLGAIVLE